MQTGMNTDRKRSVATPLPMMTVSTVCARPRRKDFEMKIISAAIASLALIAASSAQAAQTTRPGWKPMLPVNDIQMVAPALEKYTQAALLGATGRKGSLRETSPLIAKLKPRRALCESAFWDRG
jgi:hypothetical protein